MKASDEEVSCPECGEAIAEVFEYVTEQRIYRFSLTRNEYVGSSDPVDDSAKLDWVICSHCLQPLRAAFVRRLFRLYDAFATSP